MRTKRALLNMVSDIIPQILIAILGLFKIKIFINLLGSNQVGLYQLYTQIFAYLILAEGGVGSAVLFRLYAPVAKKSQKEIDSIMSAAKRIFRIITFIMIGIGIVLSFNIKLFLNENPFSTSFLAITFIIFLLSQTINYFVIPEKILFDANQKKYIPNLIFQIISIIRTIIEIIIVLKGGKIISILISLLISNTIANFILILAYKKEYGKFNKKAKPDMSITKDVKHLFVNTIGTLITNNIDVIIISKFINLTSVVIYTSYNYICSTLITMIEKLTGATMSGIANILLESKKKAYDIFLEYNSLVFYIATIIGVPLMYALNPFIRIFYSGDVYTNKLLSILFVSILIYQVIKIPLKTFTFAAGEFAKIKKYVIAECVVNLGLSVFLSIKFGIFGVLIGTLISLLTCDYYPKSKTILRYILEVKEKEYHFTNLKLIIPIIILSILSLQIPTNYNSILTWFITSGIVFTINGILITAYYYYLKKLSFLKRLNLKKMFKRS